MAVWSALRTLLPGQAVGSPSTSPSFVQPRAAVSLGGVLDLAWAARQPVGGDAVCAFMGGAPLGRGNKENPSWPDAAALSPIDMLPPVSESLRQQARAQGRALKLPDCLVGLVHAQRDEIVDVSQSIRFTVSACTSGMELELHQIADESHFDCLDPSSLSFQTAFGILQRGLRGHVPHYASAENDGMLPTLRQGTARDVLIRTRAATTRH